MFHVNNGDAKLTRLNSGLIKYEDLSSKTTLVFEQVYLMNVSLEQENGNLIVLNAEQENKFLEALQIPKNIDDMISIVDTAKDKLLSLSRENKRKNESQPNPFELKQSPLVLKSIENALERINAIKSNEKLETSSLESTPKPK